ncbi:MAG TPA: hypothetical protein PKA37_03415 [Planctomycetota bacterium]|nr:hypothetical protein [Planctomycetota bacterium]
MEKSILEDSRVREALRKFVVLQIYQDEPGRQDEFTDLQMRLVQTLMLPTYAVVEPTSELAVRKWGFDPTNLTVDAYLKDLEKGTRAADAVRNR